MKIFVDFDNTIFDTRHQFLEEFFGVFEKYGVSQNVFDNTLPHFSKTALQTGECYSPQEHIKIIKKITGKNIDEKVFLREMAMFLEDLEECIFADFYAFAHHYEKKDLIILSYGNHDFQKQKIDGSGVRQFFADIIITQGDKAKEIKKYMYNFPSEEAVLIDDKLGYFVSIKELSVNTKTIHILRGDNVCDDDEFCDMHVSELIGTDGIINNMSAYRQTN